MALAAFVAGVRSAIFDDLKAGNPPRMGSFSAELFRKVASKGAPQLGSVRYETDAIWLEFIYPESGQGTGILEVRVDPPERIIFLSVPAWVVENVWEGDVTGSYHLESDARTLVNSYLATVGLGSPQAD